MSEKIAVNTTTQEQWDDVSKRLGYVWSIAIWKDCYEESCILLNKKAKGDKEDCSGMGYKIISYEEFIKDRIDSIEDIERLWKEERLDKIVVNGGSVHNMPYFDLDNEKGHINHYEIHLGFKNINLKETQKLIKKEKKMLNCKVKIVEKFKNVYSLSKGEVYEFKNGKLKHNTIDNSYNQTYLTKEEFENQIKERYKIEWIEEEKEMTKSDLVAGRHVVKTREGNLYLVMEDRVIRDTKFFLKKDINKDLFNNGIRGRDLDIIEVFEIENNFILSDLITREHLKSIWERQEKSPLQLKLEELETKSLKISKEQQEITEEIARVRGEM